MLIFDYRLACVDDRVKNVDRVNVIDDTVVLVNDGAGYIFYPFS